MTIPNETTSTNPIITTEEAAERYPDQWMLMEVTECDAYVPVKGRVVVAAKRRKDIQTTLLARVLGPRKHGEEYYVFHSSHHPRSGGENRTVFEEMVRRDIERGRK